MKSSGLIGLLFASIGLFALSGEAVSASPAKAINRSQATTCAEEDNVNVPLQGGQVNRYEIIATHPRYDISGGSCTEDFSGCSRTIHRADTCAKVWDDGVNVVEVCTVSDWWRPYSMEVLVNNGQPRQAHYLRISRKLADADSWPQFLVLYQDGNLRLKPHPPQALPDVCFGSSVIVGPAASSNRPYVDVLQASIDTSTLSMDVTYQEGGSAHVDFSVDRTAAHATVQVNYWLHPPFITFRSMFVADGNSDVDHIATPSRNVPILSDWKRLRGSSWFFNRETRSQHNTSAPDITITITETAGTPTITEE